MDTSKYSDAAVAGAMMILAAGTNPNLKEVREGALLGRGALGGMPQGSIPKEEKEKMLALVNDIKELIEVL